MRSQIPLGFYRYKPLLVHQLLPDISLRDLPLPRALSQPMQVLHIAQDL